MNSPVYSSGTPITAGTIRAGGASRGHPSDLIGLGIALGAQELATPCRMKPILAYPAKWVVLLVEVAAPDCWVIGCDFALLARLSGMSELGTVARPAIRAINEDHEILQITLLKLVAN